MGLSGWCGTRGRPDCDRCRSERCDHACHTTNPAQNNAKRRSLETVSAVDSWQNKDVPAGCVNTAARTDRTPFTRTGGRLMPIIVDPSTDSQLGNAR